VPGATNASFTLSHVILSDSANYSVLVTNGYGSALSGTAVLAVLPVLIITQPASGQSATGAVLNGSVTLGSDETVAWFEWGTDTNYGNIAGITIVPGNNGSNNISAALSGLPGNIYHYRMDAANDFGIVYGGDQPFTVGFAPTATKPAVVNSTNGWTLNATVNPNGWDTTVYFTVSDEFSFYTTTSVDIGAGTTPLNVNSFITGLTANEYRCQVVASNDLGVVGEGIGSGSPLRPGLTVFRASSLLPSLHPPMAASWWRCPPARFTFRRIPECSGAKRPMRRRSTMSRPLPVQRMAVK
jgi:hypothetical protein